MASTMVDKTRSAKSSVQRRQEASRRRGESARKSQTVENRNRETRRKPRVTQPVDARLRRQSPGRTRPNVVPPQSTQAVPQSDRQARSESGFNLSLPKLFLLSGYLIGGALVLMSALDLLIAVPFYGANAVFDVVLMFAGFLLLYLSWDARDAYY